MNCSAGENYFRLRMDGSTISCGKHQKVCGENFKAPLKSSLESCSLVDICRVENYDDWSNTQREHKKRTGIITAEVISDDSTMAIADIKNYSHGFARLFPCCTYRLVAMGSKYDALQWEGLPEFAEHLQVWGDKIVLQSEMLERDLKLINLLKSTDSSCFRIEAYMKTWKKGFDFSRFRGKVLMVAQKSIPIDVIVEAHPCQALLFEGVREMFAKNFVPVRLAPHPDMPDYIKTKLLSKSRVSSMETMVPSIQTATPVTESEKSVTGAVILQQGFEAL